MQKTSLTNRLAGFATLALAALPISALSTAAHAAPAAVVVKDLDLLTPQDNAVLLQRINTASVKYCIGRKGVSNVQACREGARAELTEKADAIRVSQLTARSSTYAAR